MLSALALLSPRLCGLLLLVMDSAFYTQTRLIMSEDPPLRLPFLVHGDAVCIVSGSYPGAFPVFVVPCSYPGAVRVSVYSLSKPGVIPVAVYSSTHPTARPICIMISSGR